MCYIKDEPISEHENVHIFDLKEYVKNEKKAELLEKKHTESSDDAEKTPPLDIEELFN